MTPAAKKVSRAALLAALVVVSFGGGVYYAGPSHEQAKQCAAEGGCITASVAWLQATINEAFAAGANTGAQSCYKS